MRKKNEGMFQLITRIFLVNVAAPNPNSFRDALQGSLPARAKNSPAQCLRLFLDACVLCSSQLGPDVEKKTKVSNEGWLSHRGSSSARVSLGSIYRFSNLGTLLGAKKKMDERKIRSIFFRDKIACRSRSSAPTPTNMTP